MSAPAVVCAGLAKAFGSTIAVDGFDLSVERGQVVALLAARLRISWRVLDTGEVRRRQLLLPGAATDGPIASYASVC